MAIKTRLLTSTTNFDKKSNLNTAYFSLARGTYGLVQVYQRLWRTCLHHQAVHSFERRYASNQTTQCHLSEEGSALLRLDTVYEFALYEKKTPH
jgi:hypothetical protein